MGGNPRYAERTILPSQVGRVGATVAPFVRQAQQPWAANAIVQPPTADAIDAANATAVGPAGHAAADDATAADANDGATATDVAGDATRDNAHAEAAGEHDGSTAAV